VERTPENKEKYLNYVSFKWVKQGCSSYVGMIGRKQEIRLAEKEDYKKATDQRLSTLENALVFTCFQSY